jgi:hypothetical protein
MHSATGPNLHHAECAGFDEIDGQINTLQDE